MNHVMVLPLTGNETLANHLAQQLHCHVGTLQQRSFPDGETYLR